MSGNITKLTPSGLAALLCARICHDLVSPVGALGTALEILDDENNTDMHDDAMDLIKTSSRQASSKLKFLRLAFGAGGSAPGVIGVEEIKSLVNNMFGGSKAALNWTIESDGLEKNSARVLLNLVMLAVQSVPRGGDVTIGQDGSNFVLTATGPKARLDTAVEKTLAGKAPDDGFDGRSIQPFYTGMIAREIGGSVSAAITDDTVKFTATLPAV